MLGKTNFMSVIWMALIGAVLFMVYKIFGKSGGLDKLGDGANDGIKDIGEAIGNIGEAVANTSEAVLDMTREGYETKEYKNALQKLQLDCDKKRKGKKRILNDEILKSRAKSIHLEFGNWNEDETLILSQFFTGIKMGHVKMWKDNPHNKAIHPVMINAVISYGDYYTLKKFFGLASENDTLLNVFDKILYRCPELNYHMNFIIKNLRFK